METSELLAGGMVLVTVCVVLVIGGLFMTTTYQAANQAVTGSSPFSTSCWQDSANISPACSDGDPGSYYDTSWNVGTPEASFDEDWSTYSDDLCDNYFMNMFEADYYYPSNMTAASWRVKQMDNGVISTINYPITNVSCDDGGGYYTILTVAWFNSTTQDCQLSYGCEKPGGGYTFFNGVPGVGGPPP